MQAILSSHDATSNRFRASKLSEKKKGKKPYMFSHQKYSLSLSSLSRMFMPYIKWDTHKSGTHSIVSTVGRQHTTAGFGNGRGINIRRDLQKIYKKIYTDICFAPALLASTSDQVRPFESVWGSQKLDITGLSSEAISALVSTNPEMPTLICHSFTRTFELYNVLNTVMYVECNEWVAKDDFTDDPRTVWLAGLNKSGTDGQSGYGFGLWPRNSEVPISEYSELTTDTPGLRPWKSMKELWNNWYVLKTTRYKIEPGSSIKHAVRIPGFKCSFSNLFHPEKHDKPYIGGLSVHVQFITIGEKCFDGIIGDQAKSYMNSEMHTDYNDKASWSMKPKMRSQFRIITNPPEDFDVTLTNASVFPVATAPTILVPSGSVVTAQTPVDYEPTI